MANNFLQGASRLFFKYTVAPAEGRPWKNRKILKQEAAAKRGTNIKRFLKKVVIMFKQLAFLMLLFTSFFLSYSTANAYLFNLAGAVSDTGTGFGDVSNILTVQKETGTEIGAVTWDGSARVLTGDAKNTSKIWLITDIIAKGITNPSQMGIVYNINQPGSDLDTLLNYFTIVIYNPNGTIAFQTLTNSGASANFGKIYDPVAQGTGGAGWLFDLDPSLESLLNPYFTNPDTFRLGMSASIGNARGGPENFFFAKLSGVTPVPEPVSMLLLGIGLIGFGWYARRTHVS